jgi:hypothetical protein
MSGIYDNFKYHTLEEVENLIASLKGEIEHIKRTHATYGLNAVLESEDGLTRLGTKMLKINEEMLHAAENEVLERTLLK